MLEQRHSVRRRVYLGGRISFNERQSSCDCIVRNFSADGARIECRDIGALPRRIDLILPCKGTAFIATLVWWRHGEAGLALHEQTPDAGPHTLDTVLRQRALERANRALRHCVDQLSTLY